MDDANKLRSSNDLVLDKYLHTPFWNNEDQEASLLDTECVMEFPYAPPGMYQRFDKRKRPLLKDWFRRTVKDWSRKDIIKYPTLNPSRFWVESRTRATVTWGDSFERPFDSTHIELIVIESSKIVLIRTWSDPLAYYSAAGITLPPFLLSVKPIRGTPMPDVPAKDLPSNEAEAAIRRKELFSYYIYPDFSDPERDSPAVAHLFDADFKFRMPYMPFGLQRESDADDKATMKKWVHETLVEWHQNSDVTQDEFLDPDISILESNGSYGRVRWNTTGATSGYCNDYVIFIKLKNFRFAEFREYLDPVAHLLPTGVSFPVFPFFN